MRGGYLWIFVCIPFSKCRVHVLANEVLFSSLTWGVLQEKVLTTPYTNPADGSTEKWQFPVFLQVIQSLLSSITGSMYLYTSTPAGQPVPPIIPTRRIILPLLLVAVCQALAAPIGYAALAHVNYITYTLAKSCKLLPVMFLHITLFRKKYPLYKYLVVLAVTVGVAIFTLHSGKKKKSSSHGGASESGQTAWGMLLLSINLLFDGLTNSTQDWIVSEFKPYRGPQMMCANNMMSSALSGGYLLLSPWLVATGLGRWFGMAEAVGGSGAGELSAALGFMARHPGVWWDVLGFAACGAVGQVFICKFTSITCTLFPFLKIDSSGNQLLTKHNSLYHRQLRLRHPRYRHRHPQDANHDPLRRLVRPQSLRDAVARRRPRLWRDRRGSSDQAPD